MKANKDKGTSVGFSKDTILQKFGVDTEIEYGIKGKPTDFKIEENIKVIESNKWVDIYSKFFKTKEYKTTGNFHTFSVFKKWLMENYLPPEKKNP